MGFVGDWWRTAKYKRGRSVSYPLRMYGDYFLKGKVMLLKANTLKVCTPIECTTINERHSVKLNIC
jgi:hypothetical protein